MKIGAEGAEGLDRDDATWADVGAAEQHLEALADRLVGRARQQTEQAAFTLEQPPDGSWDRESPVSIRHGRKDLGRELLGQQRRAFGLAARANPSLPATERQQVLAAAGRAANAGETVRPFILRLLGSGVAHLVK